MRSAGITWVDRAKVIAEARRIAHYLPASSRPIDITVYTLAEVERFAASPPPVLREALARGIDLLPDDEAGRADSSARLHSSRPGPS